MILNEQQPKEEFDLDASYQQMAEDEGRESEALELVAAVIGDASDEAR